MFKCSYGKKMCFVTPCYAYIKLTDLRSNLYTLSLGNGLKISESIKGNGDSRLDIQKKRMNIPSHATFASNRLDLDTADSIKCSIYSIADSDAETGA